MRRFTFDLIMDSFSFNDTWILSFSRPRKPAPNSYARRRRPAYSIGEPNPRTNYCFPIYPRSILPKSYSTAVMLLFSASPRQMSSSNYYPGMSSVILYSISSKCLRKSSSSSHSLSLGLRAAACLIAVRL